MKCELVLQELLSGCGYVKVVKVASFSYGTHIKKWFLCNNFPGHPGEYKKGMTKFLGLEGTSGDYPIQHPTKAVSPRAGDTEAHPGGLCVYISRMENPQPPWAVCSSAMPSSM